MNWCEEKIQEYHDAIREGKEISEELAEAYAYAENVMAESDWLDSMDD